MRVKGRNLLNDFLGFLAVCSGLALAQLLSSFVTGLHTPVISVGNRVIDHVPTSIKEFAIRTFGVNDKQALVFTIYSVILLLSLYIGHLYFTGRQFKAQTIVVVMAAISGISSLFDAGANLFSIIPSLTVGGTTIWILQTFEEAKAEKDPAAGEVDRRELFRTVGFIAAGSVLAATAGNLFRTHASTQLQRLNVLLPKALKTLPPPPPDPAITIPGLSELFTPNKKFYRIDTAITVPEISVDTWVLKIDGMVDHPLELTYKELTSRPTFELDDTIACVSNEVGGSLVGNARWLGIRLDDLIKEVSPQSSADQIMGHSVDGFTAGFPLAALDGRDAMIAIGMNAEPLPLNHGFPARIIVPGLYGYVSATKWLTRIELTRFDKAEGYWVPRGWSVQAPIKISSRIDTPINTSTVKPGKQAIAGVAWAPTHGISKVEVRVNSGSWRVATLGPALAKTTWRQWWVDWDAIAGNSTISVRATDADGKLQSQKNVSVAPDGAEGWHTIRINVRA